MSPLTIRDLGPAFGAEVEGFDPSTELDEAQRKLLRNAFDDRGLLLLREVDVDHPLQVSLSLMAIGTDEAAADDGSRAFADDFYISNRKEDAAAPYGKLLFHSDTMWSDDPAQVLSLYAVDVEPPVAPTIFASAVHAWRTLPDELRARVVGLHAEHVAGAVLRGDEQDEVLVSTFQRPPSTITPVGHRHPRTGQMMLYVCQQMTRAIVELPPDESEALLEELFDHLYRPEVRWEHEWRNGDLVVWDNIAIQHGRSDVRLEGPIRTLRKFFSPVPSLDPDQLPTYSTGS